MIGMAGASFGASNLVRAIRRLCAEARPGTAKTDSVRHAAMPSMSCTWARLSCAIVGIAGAALGAAQPRAQQLQYDSSSCHPDAAGLVYIALGREVFRWPQEELTLIRDLPPELRAEALQPPDPSEQEGCPGNPIQAAGFDFVYRPGDLPTRGIPERLELIAARPDFWGLQKNAEQHFLRTCERWHEREETGYGFVACAVPPSPPRLREQWATHYQAKLEIYRAPFDRPFTVLCSYEIVCDIEYKLYETVNIAYSFRRDRVPISEVIDFDRSLRSRIERSRVSDFQWKSR
jgi:hypothetical protein